MRARRGPSHRATERRPPKKLKCDKRNRAKLKIPEVDVCGNSSSVCSKEPAKKISEADERSPNLPVLKMMLQSEGKAIPKISEELQVDRANFCAETSASGANSCSPEAESEPLFLTCVQNVEEEEEEEEREDESCGTGCSDDSEMEPEEPQDCFLEPDNSAFLNEDSNQPLPVDRFFGSVAFMQEVLTTKFLAIPRATLCHFQVAPGIARNSMDLPPPSLARAPTNRRELRKLHFIAKEDDDDEDVI